MGILTRFTLRTLAKSRARTVVSIIGIALSCALITAIFTTITSIEGGLVQHELETSGSWEVSFAGLSPNALTRLENDERATDVAVSYELGSAITGENELEDSADETSTNETDGDTDEDVETDAAETASSALSYSSYLTVKTLPQTTKGTETAVVTKGASGAALAVLPTLTEGRLPQSEGEIVLPLSFKGEQPQDYGVTASEALELGSTVTLSLGQRVRTDAQGAQTPQSCADTAAQLEGSGATEELVDASPRTYTVVGFVSTSSYGYTGDLISSAAGNVALTAATDAQSTGENASAIAYATTNIPTYNQIQDWTDEICGTTNYRGTGTPSVAVMHDSLLRWQGRTSGRAIWATLWQLAAILCGVVMLASVSLIYTAFAISVAERTRQLGLLSGIGASRRQLRQSVLAEALILGAAGIPAGLALGIVGTAITLSVMSEEFSSMLMTTTKVTLTLDWRVLLVAVALSLVTLLVSALIPAVKAGRTSAVDAMRQAGTVRIRTHRGHIGGRVAQTLFGIPALVAHRNLTRSGSRSYVVVASLAVSVTLVIVCGCLDAYMQPLMGMASSNGYPEGTDALVVLSTYGTNEENLVDNAADKLASLRSQIDDIEGAGEVAVELSTSVTASIPASMVSADTVSYLKSNEGVLSASVTELLGDSATSEQRELTSVADDGSVAAGLSIYYLEDSDWRAYVSQLGLSEDEYCDTANPRGIGVNSYVTSDGSRYTTTGGLSSPGTITLYNDKLSASDADAGTNFYGVFTTPDGQVKLAYTGLDGQGNTTLTTIDANEASCVQQLEVGHVTTEVPNSLKGTGINYTFPQVILPASAIASTAGVTSSNEKAPSCLSAQVASLCLSLDDTTDASKKLEDVVSVFSEKLFSEDNGNTSLYVNNLSESAKNSLDACRLFKILLILFSVITMLIALANVFNTLTNSIILRTREFAMLRSCGMGDAAFAKMMVYECASYALRGLLIGIVLAGGISRLMWDSMQLSFNGLGVALPLPYVLLACAGTAVVLALSAAYALWRSHAQNLVDALRCDAL